jgi:single-strand DNA-binding protein
MNSITVAGTVGRDAEVRYLQNGDAVCGFTVADSEGRDKPTIWWSCQLWGKRAEGLSQYITKGSKVTVTGRVTERSYTDKNGQEKKVMDVRVNDIALQGKPSGSHDEPVKPKQKPADDFEEESIPF